MSQTATMTQVREAPSAVAMPPARQHKSLLESFQPPTRTSRVVTAAELADNCGIGSDSGRAWISLHGHVFDITEFSAVHPGGQSIRLAAGRDATCLVESYHPGTSMPRVEAAIASKTTYIGVMEPTLDSAAAVVDKKVAKGSKVAAQMPVRPDDAFFLDVRARVESFITHDLQSSRYAYDTIGLVEALLTFAVYVVAVYQVGRWGSWPWTLVLGFLTGRMGFLMHMANHCATTRDPNRNRLIGWFMDIIGSNATIWGYEHQVAHHVEPNEYHRDNDCEIGAPAVRMHPEVPHESAFTMHYQHIVVPIAMTIGLLKWYVGDFGHFVRKQVGNVRMAIDRSDWALLLSFKGLWFLLHIVFPVYYNGWGLAMLQLLVFMGLGGHYLENIFIVNHIQNGLVPPASAHWANKQVLATVNWKSGSLFWNWFSGGLNHQVEHHMFPSLSHYWYPHISHIVKATCQQHNLDYYDYPNFGQAWIAMITYLKDMGDENFVSKTGQKGAVAPAPASKATKSQ